MRVEPAADNAPRGNGDGQRISSYVADDRQEDDRDGDRLRLEQEDRRQRGAEAGETNA